MWCMYRTACCCFLLSEQHRISEEDYDEDKINDRNKSSVMSCSCSDYCSCPTLHFFADGSTSSKEYEVFPVIPDVALIERR